MSRPRSRNQPITFDTLCEAEVVTGLKAYATDEVRNHFGKRVEIIPKDKPEEFLFRYSGELTQLFDLAQAVTVYLVEHYPIPRPLALLGHQHFTTLMRQITEVRALHPAGTFRTFRISAAGSDSSVFTRIKNEIQAATGLIPHDEEADMVLRVRKSDVEREGWDVLVRLTPRPLSARAWRSCDMLGALNATIASAMVEMTQPLPQDRVLNIMCGSGTLMIERLRRGKAEAVGGLDIDAVTLRCAQRNIESAGLDGQIDLFEMDAMHLQLPDASIDMICGDLPWGQLIGSHEANQALYPPALAEAARVAASGARAVFITHEIRLMEQCLADLADKWVIKNQVRVFQGGLHPRIYLLGRLS
jgi:ubiquinone/menaquinone biosynthesis C-methylase UbiE